MHFSLSIPDSKDPCGIRVLCSQKESALSKDLCMCQGGMWVSVCACACPHTTGEEFRNMTFYFLQTLLKSAL